MAARDTQLEMDPPDDWEAWGNEEARFPALAASGPPSCCGQPSGSPRRSPGADEAQSNTPAASTRQAPAPAPDEAQNNTPAASTRQVPAPAPRNPKKAARKAGIARWEAENPPTYARPSEGSEMLDAFEAREARLARELATAQADAAELFGDMAEAEERAPAAPPPPAAPAARPAHAGRKKKPALKLGKGTSHGDFREFIPDDDDYVPFDG